jgi:hypothetical protein
MNSSLKDQIEVGYQVFVADGGEEVGAVRDLCGNRPEIVIYVENAGEFTLPVTAIKAVHYQKVVLDAADLPEDLRAAMKHAHEAETS